MVGLALLLSGCAGRAPVAPALAPSAVGPQAERPTYILGDRWIRNDGIWEVIRVEPDRYIFSAATGVELQITKDLALARFWRTSGAVAEFTPVPRIDWPLAVGRKGTSPGKFQASYGGPYDAQLHWEVEAYEDVTVPAGTFKAFRIAYTITPRRGDTNFGPRYPYSGAAPVA
jgi:hypothetical protein